MRQSLISMLKMADILSEILKPHNMLTVVGANWGDEGKGKVIDLVMGHYDITARFSGGANAGHTVYTPEGKKIVSHLIPCGLAQNKICVLGRGEFFNAQLFLNELKESSAILGVDLPPIYVDFQSSLWTPYHELFEIYLEAIAGKNKLGTTNKGIGPLEGFYKLRIAPVVGMLFKPDLLSQTLFSLHGALCPLFDSQAFVSLGLNVPSPEEVARQLTSYAPLLKDYVVDTSYFLDSQFKQGRRILMEGAQATGLDALWGTYPYVSAGNSVAAGAALGGGLPPGLFSSTILVTKTLPTRVGFGPFVSEMWDRKMSMVFAKENADLFEQGKKRSAFLADGLSKINNKAASKAELAQYFQVLGGERGATTGRGRSVGFLDIPWLCYAARINGPKWLALTRFDMLSGLKSIPVVTAYRHKGKILPNGLVPPAWDMTEIEPVFEEWDCWEQDIFGMNEFLKLPAAAQKFLSGLEKLVGVPILMVGTGPGRQDMVIIPER